MTASLRSCCLLAYSPRDLLGCEASPPGGMAQRSSRGWSKRDRVEKTDSVFTCNTAAIRLPGGHCRPSRQHRCHFSDAVRTQHRRDITLTAVNLINTTHAVSTTNAKGVDENPRRECRPAMLRYNMSCFGSPTICSTIRRDLSNPNENGKNIQKL
jgi:hypothetical protein